MEFEVLGVKFQQFRAKNSFFIFIEAAHCCKVGMWKIIHVKTQIQIEFEKYDSSGLEDFLQHPDYDKVTLRNDICLIQENFIEEKLKNSIEIFFC